MSFLRMYGIFRNVAAVCGSKSFHNKTVLSMFVSTSNSAQLQRGSLTKFLQLHNRSVNFFSRNVTVMTKPKLFPKLRQESCVVRSFSLFRSRTLSIPDELWVLIILGVFVGVGYWWNQKNKTSKPIIDRKLKKRVRKAQMAIDNGNGVEAFKLYKEALLFAEESVKIAQKDEKAGLPDRTTVVFIMDQLANLAYHMGNWTEAELYFKDTLRAMIGSNISKEDDAVIEISFKLAKIYAAQNKPDMALEGFKWCAETAENKIEENPSENSYALLGMCLDGYGDFLVMQKRAEDACEVYEKCLETCKALYDDQHPQTAVVMNSLANAYTECGRYHLAGKFTRKAIRIAKENDKESLPTYIHNLGTIFMYQGDMYRAKKSFIRALRMAEDISDSEMQNLIKGSMTKLDINAG